MIKIFCDKCRKETTAPLTNAYFVKPPMEELCTKCFEEGQALEKKARAEAEKAYTEIMKDWYETNNRS